MVPSGALPGAHRALLGLPLLLACCLLPPGVRAQFSVWLEPQDHTMPAGGTLLVNCSTDCPSPGPIFLETSLSKELRGRSNGWVAFQLHNVADDSQVLCAVTCGDSQIIRATNLTVYRLPERVELAPLPAWQPVGENVSVRCLVAGGAPRDRLSVVLLRGAEELSRQPAAGDPAEVTATVLARREDDGARFSCRAELDLRPRGLELLQNASAPRELRTFVLPVTPPHLTAPRLLEAGTSLAVTCTLGGLFPASEARVHLALGDQSLNPNVTHEGDTVTATATARPDQEGARELVCNVSLGGRSSANAKKVVTVHSFLGPNLTLSDSSAPEGTTVTVTCTSGARAQVALNGTPAEAPGQPAQLHLKATKEDDRRSFFCTATLVVDRETLRRNASALLRVLYGPKMDRAECPERWSWREKTYQVLRCQARGNPAPRLRCVHELSGNEVPVETQFRVLRNHSGTYSCQAASSRGNASLLVVLEVQNRNVPSVVVALVVLLVLGLVTLAVASVSIFKWQNRSGIYRVKPATTTTSVPLSPLQPAGEEGVEPS